MKLSFNVTFTTVVAPGTALIVAGEIVAVPAEVAGAGTNEMTAEFEPAPLTATAVTCDGAAGAAGAGAGSAGQGNCHS